MKIVAKVTDDVVLVQMDTREVAQIVGLGWESSMRERYGYRCFEVGTVHRVGDIFGRLNALEENSKRLGDAAKTLRAVADLVDAQLPACAFAPVTEAPKVAP